MRPSPKTGNGGTLVPPAAPKAPKPADNVMAGEAEKLQKLIDSQYPPPKSPTPDPNKAQYIEIVLTDEKGVRVRGAGYSITLPDGFSPFEALPDSNMGTLTHNLNPLRFSAVRA